MDHVPGSVFGWGETFVAIRPVLLGSVKLRVVVVARNDEVEGVAAHLRGQVDKSRLRILFNARHPG